MEVIPKKFKVPGTIAQLVPDGKSKKSSQVELIPCDGKALYMMKDSPSITITLHIFAMQFCSKNLNMSNEIYILFKPLENHF